MEIKILEERTNPLLKRHELRFEVSHPTTATPTRESVRTELAKTVSAPKDRVIIERMNPRFGTALTRGEANVYDTAEAAASITREHILVRNGLKEKQAKGPGPAPSAPAPAETPKAESRAAAAAEPVATPPVKSVPTEPPAAAAPVPHPKAGPSEASGTAEVPKKGKAHAKKE